MNILTKVVALLLPILALLLSPHVNAQISEHKSAADIFGRNWFVSAAAGAHTFQNTFSCIGNFNGTISPEWSLGVGNWIFPCVGLRLDYLRSKSQGYTLFLTEHYGTGPIEVNDQNIPYRAMETSWSSLSGNLIVNLTRLFGGFEGDYNSRHMDQLIASVGLGVVHHLGFQRGQGSDNEFAGNAEFQYSRFFTKSKKISLDLKLRGAIFQSSFENEYGAFEYVRRKLDSTIGMDIGLTYYIGTGRSNTKNRSETLEYRRDFREKEIPGHRQRVDTTMTKSAVGVPRTLTFYLFFPDNNSIINGGDDFFGSETCSLNSHSGIPILLDYMNTELSDCLVSLADVCAALDGYKFNLTEITNPQTVDMIRDILHNGITTLIEVHCGSTDHDFTTNGASEQARSDGTPFNEQRAQSIVKWLKGYDIFEDTKSILYIDKGFIDSGVTIDEKLSKELFANLNNCMKVRLQVIY